MPFNDDQLRTAAQLVTNQLFGIGMRRTFVEATGITQSSARGSILTALQEQADVRRLAETLGADKPEFVEDVFQALKEAISDPKLFGAYQFVNSNSLTGFNIHTNSRGGFNPILTSALEKHGIAHGYGDLPSIDLYCYNDGAIVFCDRRDESIKTIPYKGYQPTHKWVRNTKEVKCEESIYIKNPNPFLIKTVAVGTSLTEVINGKLTAKSNVAEDRPEYQSQTIILRPSNYYSGLRAEDIDKKALRGF